MTNEQILALQKEYPKVTCLRCTSLVYTTFKFSDNMAYCSKNLEPTSCGRNFNPNGGTKVGVC